MFKLRYATFILSSAGLAALALPAAAAPAPAPADDASKTATVSEVVITAAPREEVKARKVQHDAINLISVQSAETISKYPDFNAAEALARMPGVSLSSDTGEGRFVNIRGIDGNLAGATFGGVVLLNTFPGGTSFGGGGRQVEFDTIPTGAIDGLIVTKTTLPDHEAEGLGGSIELTPRTAAHITKPFIDGTLGWGYENERAVTGPFEAELAVGARFGFHNGLVVEGVNAANASGSGWISNPTPFSFVITASRKDDRRGFNDIEEGYNSDESGLGLDHTYSNLQMRRYTGYHRRRFSVGGEFDFTPNDDHHYYFRANLAGYTESVIKNFLTYRFSNPTPDATNPNFIDDIATLRESSTKEQETHRNTVFVVGGQDKFGDTVIDYRASYSRATFYEPYNYGSSWNGPKAAVAYNNLGNNGDFPIIRITDGTNPNDPNLYTLRSLSNSQETDFDQEWSYALNVLLPFRLINDNDRFKIGAEVRLRDKQSVSFGEQTDDGVNPPAPNLTLANYSSPAVTNFYGYTTNGPYINAGAVAAITQLMSSGNGFNFGAKENIFAGYAQYDARIGKWGFLVGARVEATQAAYTGFDASVNPPGDTNVPPDGAIVTDRHSYTNVFPTVQVRYDFTPNLLLRAIYSTGIGRPGFNQVVSGSQSNHAPPPDSAITSGNPNLQPTTGEQFDLSLEYYLPRGGVIQAGFFDREFSNYIVTDVYRAVDTVPGSEFFGGIVTYTGFRNISGAYARGAEVAYHQQYTWLPKPFDGLGLDVNATMVDSQIKEYSAATSATGHDEFGLLPGTARLTWNLAGFYEAHGVEARIAAEYVAPMLFGLSGNGGDKANDTIEDKRLTVYWGSSYQFTPHWKAYFNVKNLTNTPLRYYNERSSLPIQREYYEQTFEFGLRAKY
jgi:TonB-dependent receptor